MYYWVIDYKETKSGDYIPVVIGGRAFPSELQAQKYIDDSNLSRRAEIFELDTCNQDKATGAIKAILIRRYKSLDKGMMRASHRS